MNLRKKLISEGKTKLLDIGNGGKFDRGFEYLDLLPNKRKRKNYYQIDVRSINKKDLSKIGKFDLVRMQHFFEHLDPEDGVQLLNKLPVIMNKGAFIVMTVPDLRIHIQHYLKKDYRKELGFCWWAYKRIKRNAPMSYYFSIFTHSMPWENHKWCYDFEGLEYIVKSTGKYKNIRELKLDDELASFPFTHSRPREDVCLIAEVK